jgi:hypothetical protein
MIHPFLGWRHSDRHGKKSSSTKTDAFQNFRYAFFKPAESRGL